MIAKNGNPDDPFDVIVIGGGHAGCEAYAAASRVGVRAALVTPSLDDIAAQPCNPAVGGPGKGHLVREIVALGGVMGRVTDRSGLQFRTLNRKKGPAVRATRVQTDSRVYVQEMAQEIQRIAGGRVIEDRAVGLHWTTEGARRRITGVTLEQTGRINGRAVVIATGTFLRGQLFIGDQVIPGGRRDAPPAVRLAESLEAIGLPMMRLKTGTCPRLDGSTIDTDALEPQISDDPMPFFDPQTRAPALPQLTCYLTYTGPRTHEVIRRTLDQSALYSGAITGIGPRYCPSIETKIARFPDKDRHQVFLEPEDQRGRVVYPSGISTSLPAAVQDEFVHAIDGLHQARIVRYGYAVEYDAIQPRVLTPSLEVDGFDGLFLAGQFLGTSGYEEAAALGLFAGANAALRCRGEAGIALRRDQSYLGVMIDDLTTLGIDEPYRMFTSRAEFRLLLREDNADERLIDVGLATGLVDGSRAREITEKRTAIAQATERLRTTALTPSEETNTRLGDLGLSPVGKPVSLFDYLRRTEVHLRDLLPLAPWIGELPDGVAARVEVDVKYEGYLARQQSLARQLQDGDRVRLPADFDFDAVPGLKKEAVEKLNQARPKTLGQAGRIPGITPATVQMLHVWCRRLESSEDGDR